MDRALACLVLGLPAAALACLAGRDVAGDWDSAEVAAKVQVVDEAWVPFVGGYQLVEVLEVYKGDPPRYIDVQADGCGAGGVMTEGPQNALLDRDGLTYRSYGFSYRPAPYPGAKGRSPRPGESWREIDFSPFDEMIANRAAAVTPRPPRPGLSWAERQRVVAIALTALIAALVLRRARAPLLRPRPR